MGRLVRDRLRGKKILGEAAGVRIEKLLNPIVTRRFENESRVMKLVDAIDDFLVVVG